MVCGLDLGKIACEEYALGVSSVDVERQNGGLNEGEGHGHEEKWIYLRENREHEPTELDGRLNVEMGRTAGLVLWPVISACPQSSSRYSWILQLGL